MEFEIDDTMRKLTILVSPHPDDIALSVGGMIIGNMLPKPLLGVSIFTRSAHASYGYRGMSPIIKKALPRRLPALTRFEKSLSLMEITRHRKREDLRFFKLFGIPCIDLNLLDAPLRGYRNPMRVSQIMQADFATFDTIRSAMLKLTSKAESGYLLVPLGLGNHIDHSIVRNACLSAHGALSPVYYEDLPYTADLSLEEIDRSIADFDSSLQSIAFEIKEYLNAKIANMKIYSTQIGRKEIDRTARHANRLSSKGACERLWLSGNRATDAIW